MTGAETTRERFPLCADASRAAGEDPIGTASHWQEVLVLELDMAAWAQIRDSSTWTPAQTAVMERLGEKVKAAGVGYGLLKSAPLEQSSVSGGPLRARHYTLRAAGGGYVRQDYVLDAPQGEWERAVNDILLDAEGPGSSQPSPTGLDYHVCTNGTVDASCGKYGVPVHAALNSGGDGVRAWRTAHFGGHRLAATAVELPTGLMWAHLTPELALQIARREVTPAEVAQHLRGYCGLSRLAQVLDRKLLLRHGWDWLDAARWAEVDGEEVTLHHVWQGVTGHTRARVTEREPLQIPGSSHKPGLSTIKQYDLEVLSS